MSSHGFSYHYPPFPDLPLDTLVHIQRYLDPPDIVTMRQVCKSLLRATQERTVWIHALDRLCRQMNIMAGTYSVQDMSLPQLEHVACSPFRLPELLEQKLAQGTLAEPLVARTLRGTVSGGLKKGQRFIMMEIMPGGRFLFSLTEDAAVHLWDLDHITQLGSQPRPIAMWRRRKREKYDITVMDVRIDNNTAYVLVTCAMNTHLEITVLTIEPGTPRPGFEVYQACTVGGVDTFYFSLFAEDHVFVAFEQVGIIWDWVRDEWMKFEVDKPWNFNQPYYHSHQIMAWQEEVDAPRLGVLAVWEVPPLVPRDSKPVPPLHSLGTPEYLVSAELPLQNGCIPDIFRAILPFQLHERSSAPSSPGLYIFGHDEADKSCKYAKYRLHPTTQHPHLGSSFCIPAFSHSHTSPIPSWTPDMDLRLVPLANGQNAVITSLGSDDAIVNAFLLPSGTAGTECSSFGSIWKRRLLPDIFFTSHLPVLDPVSGRVCAPITGTQIQIMDYVMPRM